MPELVLPLRSRWQLSRKLTLTGFRPSATELIAVMSRAMVLRKHAQRMGVLARWAHAARVQRTRRDAIITAVTLKADCKLLSR